MMWINYIIRDELAVESVSRSSSKLYLKNWLVVICILFKI